jgi:hypothetical protein
LRGPHLSPPLRRPLPGSRLQGLAPARAQRAAAELAPGTAARARAWPGERAGRAGGRGRSAARRCRRADGRAARRRHGRGLWGGLRVPGSPPGSARSRLAAVAASAASGETVPAAGATCLGPSVRRGGGAPGPGGSGERRSGARHDASSRWPPCAAPRRAAPQPVPPARVPGPLPHRAGARGHADGARMPHRGCQLRRLGAHHLGPRPPLLPLLGWLLGECLRPRRGTGLRARARGRGREARQPPGRHRERQVGARMPRVGQLQRGVQFKTPGRITTPGTGSSLLRIVSPWPLRGSPEVLLLGVTGEPGAHHWPREDGQRSGPNLASEAAAATKAGRWDSNPGLCCVSACLAFAAIDRNPGRGRGLGGWRARGASG